MSFWGVGVEIGCPAQRGVEPAVGGRGGEWLGPSEGWGDSCANGVWGSESQLGSWQASCSSRRQPMMDLTM